MAATFVPRAVFEATSSLPRSYFLGHHKSGLEKMKRLLTSIDLVIECRDYRIPLTSRNPLFEEALAGKERVIVHTKRDLGRDIASTAGGGGGGGGGTRASETEQTIRQWHHPTRTFFSTVDSTPDVKAILRYARDAARGSASLAGARMLVVGMPNVGKSSLLNALRRAGTGRGKAATTGGQPGVTRKVGTGVKIVEAEDEAGGAPPVYLLDTPGVFVPYVPDAQAMLKLALCGCVKDTVIAPATLADYCLFVVNRLHSPLAYAEYCPPTNDVAELLEAVARGTGRLRKGGVPDVDAAAVWLVQRWRSGQLGRFLLDDVTADAWQAKLDAEKNAAPSMSQALKVEREARRARGRTRLAAVG